MSADSPESKLILERIVPTIARMRITHPLSMATMFSRALIERFSVSKNIDCTDLSTSDLFFGSIIQKCVSNTNFMPAIDKHDCQLIRTPRQKSLYLEGLYCFRAQRYTQVSIAKDQSWRAPKCKPPLQSAFVRCQ